MPVGVRTDGSEGEIAAVKAAGVTDVLLNAPVGAPGWENVIARTEAAGLRYLLCVNSLAPMAKGFTVDPAANRIAGIDKPVNIELDMPGATSALTVLITRRDTSIEKVQRVPVSGGKLKMLVKPLNDLEHVLLVYPEAASLVQTDYWEGFDAHRDRLLLALKNAKLGPGLRGLVNPLGSAFSIGTSQTQFIPSSTYFQVEYRSFLKEKYKSPETLVKAWMINPGDLATFEDFSRLVPLWSGTRGVYEFWDPKTDRLYHCTNRRSVVWDDVQSVMNAAAVRRYQRLVRSIRQVVDVPVVQDWTGWVSPYETQSPVVDGLGMKITGSSPSSIANEASRVTSSILRWSGPGWLIATRIESTAGPTNVLDDLTAIGARGWFFTLDTAQLAGLASESKRRAQDTGTAQWSPRALFYPENASNPAHAQQLPGGVWWLPSPASGNRLDLGSKFFGYRYSDGNDSFTVLWSAGPLAKVKLRMLEPKAATIQTLDGTDPKAKVVRDGLELLMGEMPVMIRGTAEIPIPEPAAAETSGDFDRLLKLAQALQRDTTEEAFLFRDAAAGFDRNPGGSLSTMRAQLWKLNAKVGIFSWIEAERPKESTMSGPQPEAGTSSGSVLSLRTSLAGPSLQSFSADYEVPVRTNEDQEVWLAAAIPASERDRVRVTVAGQVLQIQGEPVGLYGSNYGWYKVGRTTLRGTKASVRLEVVAGAGADFAFDAILIAPPGFVPDGVTPPLAWVFK